MTDFATNITKVAGVAQKYRGLLLPLAAVGLIFVVLVPVPPALMDGLLCANIALAAVVLLTTIYVSNPLEFSVFPSVLLATTLLRLVLNVATTRLILTAGADGQSSEAARYAAGHVVWAFSQFVAKGSLPVGLILFGILAVIQFLVITKGASRISEVAARFVLDAMPGKQMAVDADLSAGLISESEARGRRERIMHETDFYGAMDGASKFLRGEAIAAVLITLINLLGGLYVGVFQYGWNMSATTSLFTRLTIGDGLVMQIPAFIVSVSAALLVTRSASRTHLGEEIVSQLTARPVALAISAVLLGALAFTSLPKIPLLVLGAGLGMLAWALLRKSSSPAQELPPAALSRELAPAPAVETPEAPPPMDVMQVELGFSLVRLLDVARGGDLMDRVAKMRRQVAEELGFIVPPIRLRDNLRLEAHSYVVRIRGTKVASGRLYPGQLLAVGGEPHAGRLIGRETVDPTFGLPSVWISPNQQGAAEVMNYTVVEPAGVLAQHLTEIVRRHAAELLSREQAQKLIEPLQQRSASLVKEVMDRLRPSRVHRVLQNLLRERVPVRDLESIFEALSEAPAVDDAEHLTEFVRSSMARSLSQQYCSEDGKLWCVGLSSELEETIGTYVEFGDGPAVSTLPPELAGKVAAAAGTKLGMLRQQGRRPVLVCASSLRPVMRKILSAADSDAAVLGYNEIDSVDVQSVANIGIEP